MKLCTLLLATLIASVSYAQTVKINDKSVVKDSTGYEYPAFVWKSLLQKGSHTLKAIDPRNPGAGFYLVEMSEEEKEKQMERIPKPRPSESFTTGKKIQLMNTADISGNKLKLKEAAGKIIVMNFWFINCKPCRMEMPELNQLVEEFRDNENVIFVGYALDQRAALKEFLSESPFNYSIVENSRYEASRYGVRVYPTHVIIDQEGKVFFHTSGYGPGTIHWIKKSIKELVASGEAKATALNQ